MCVSRKLRLITYFFTIYYTFMSSIILCWECSGIYRKEKIYINTEKKETPPKKTEELESKYIICNMPQPNGDNSTKKYAWYYLKNSKNHAVTFPSKYTAIMEKYGGIYIGDDKNKVIYLTFDEGYENGYTAKILDILKEKEVRACFFVTGSYVKKNPQLIRRMVNERHIVGNHSMNHYSMPDLTIAEMQNELKQVDQLFFNVTGEKIAPFFRPPQGEFSPLSLWVTAQSGYYSVFWSFAYRDWEVDNQKGSQYAYETIINNHHKGAIMLLHAVSQDNAQALPKVIDQLKDNGYIFGSLTEVKPYQNLIPSNGRLSLFKRKNCLFCANLLLISSHACLISFNSLFV